MDDGETGMIANVAEMRVVVDNTEWSRMGSAR